MAKIQIDKFGSHKGLSLSGNIQMYARGGQAIVAIWPRKRGKPKTPGHKQRVAFFTKQAKLAARNHGKLIAQMLEASAGTPFMPRDWFMSFGAGRALQITIPGEGIYRSKRAMVQVSFSLDQITDQDGYVLVRGADYWQGVPASSIGGSGSGWTLLDHLDAPTAGEFNWTGLDLTAVAALMIQLDGLQTAVDHNSIRLQLGNSAGLITANYKWSVTHLASNGATSAGSSGASDHVGLESEAVGWDLGNSANKRQGGEIKIFNPVEAAFKYGTTDVVLEGSGGGVFRGTGSFSLQDTSAISRIRLYGTQPITAGRVQLYTMAQAA